MLKAGFNAADDGLAGVQQLAGDATMLFYMTEEGQEGRNAFVEHRAPGLLPLSPAPVTPPLGLWVAGARPGTLPAAVVPVAVGTAVGYLPQRPAGLVTVTPAGRPPLAPGRTFDAPTCRG